MWTRREFLRRTALAGIVSAASSQLTQAALDEGASTKAPIRRTKAARDVPKSGPTVKSAIRREDTLLRYGGNGDNWHMSWAADDRQYVSLCDGAGFGSNLKEFYNSRMLAIAGGPHEAEFHDLPGYPKLARPNLGPKDTRYYNFGTLALDGYLYQFLSTFNRQFRPDELESPDLKDPLRFTGAKLIYSPDNGLNWHNQDGSTPVVWEGWNDRSRETLVFFEEDQQAFSLLTILQMGRNYEQNRDGYLYVYAPNGNTEGTMNELVMFRVPKAQILNRAAYEFFGGLSANGGPKWVKDITARAVMHTFPRGWVNKLAHAFAWHPSVVYNAPLGVYLMANWGMGTGTAIDVSSGASTDDLWFVKPSYLGFWTAPAPWGPWTQIHEETAWLPGGQKAARAYQPQIAPKWIAPDGKSFWLVWTDFQITDEGAMNQAQKERKRNGNPNSYSETDVVRLVEAMKKYQPYYGFNVQRVDLIVV